MNPKLQKVIDEIDMLKKKISRYQSRLRNLERRKTELENDEIVALVRGIDIAPDKLGEFARAYIEKQAGAAPDSPQPLVTSGSHTEKPNKEVSDD